MSPTLPRTSQSVPAASKKISFGFVTLFIHPPVLRQ
jgi:hypothetical protein